MTRRRCHSAAWCEPILWGIKVGYAPLEIAAGLGLSETAVRTIIRHWTGIQFPPAARPIEAAPHALQPVT